MRRKYTFLSENFKRISRRARDDNESHEEEKLGTCAELGPFSGQTVTFSLQQSQKKSDSARDYFNIWRKIILNDDAELLTLLRDSEPPCSDAQHLHSNFEVRHCLDTDALTALYNDCFENGLAILSHVRAHYHQDMVNGRYVEILKALTRLDIFKPIDIGGCRVMSPLSGSLLFVALLCGRLRVVEQLLRSRQFDILPMTLLVTLIVRRWILKGRFSDQARSELQKFADRTEMIAVDVLNRAHLKDNSTGKQTTLNYINVPMPTYSNMTIIDLAAKAQCTKFISLPCCQTVLTHLWLGKLYWLPPFWMWVGWFTPFLLPLYFEREQKRQNAFLRLHLRKMDSKNAAVLLSDDPKPARDNLFRSYEDLSEGARSKSYLKIMAGIFQSPAYKFFFYSLSYIIFLFLFSYVTIFKFHFKASTLEVFCFIFIIGFTVEELRLLYHSVISEQMPFYFKDYWNILSVLALVVSLMGFAVRATRLGYTADSAAAEASDSTLYAARVILLVGLMIFYLRLLFVFSLRPQIGPKIRMISAMITQDLIPMLFVFVIFFISFGVTFQGILYPNGFDFNVNKTKIPVHSGWESIKTMIRTTVYGMMAAEYNLENRDAHNYDCMPWDEGCVGPIGSTLFVYCFMIMYVLIVNIMLVNLLIALYSNTVSQIDKESTSLWLADRYNLVQEFKRRSIAPPPVNLIFVFAETLLRLYNALRQHATHVRLRQRDRNLWQEKVLISFFTVQAFALSQRRYDLGPPQSDTKQNAFHARLTSLEKSLASCQNRLGEMAELMRQLAARDRRRKVSSTYRIDEDE